jgi:hypothetical protein
MRGAFALILVFAIVSFVFDAMSNACVREQPQVAIVTFFHHLILAFALLGWLLDDAIWLFLYLLLPVVVVLQWTRQHCVFDVVVSELCGEPIKSLEHVGTKLRVPDAVGMAVIGLGLVVAAWKLWRLRRRRT